MSYTSYLLLPHLRVQSANAISGPFTHGFPSITSFMGLMWALERKCNGHQSDLADLEISFKNVGVIAHQTQELAAGSEYGVQSFNQVRRPVRKTGESAPMQEEGRMHLEFSLLFGVSLKKAFLSEAEREEIAQKILDIVENMRLAGGIFLSSALPGAPPFYKRMPRLVGKQAFEKNWRREKYRLLPGFALVERPALLEERLALLKEQALPEAPEPTRLEAFLSLCAFNHKAELTEEGKVEWQHDRLKGFGWIVPIPVGYGAIGPLHAAGSVDAARDRRIPFQAVESLHAIGEWRSLHRTQEVSEFLWCPETNPEEDIYRCVSLQSGMRQISDEAEEDWENDDISG